MTTKTDNQQLAFHAWLSRRGIALKYADDGQYEPRVQLAWEAWTTAVDEMRPRAASAEPCPICFEDEPHTGTCGSSNPCALCNQPAAPTAWEQDDMPLLDDRATYPASQVRRLIREDRARRAAPVAQEPTESVVLLDALSGLVKALRERHYGRMPDEVQAAYDKAWAIVFSSPVATPGAQEPVVWRYRPLYGGAWDYTNNSESARRAGEQGFTVETLYAAPVAAQAQQIHPAIREAVESAFEQRPGWLEKIGAAVRYLPDVAAQVQPAMPPLTEAMRAVLRNEHCVYDSEDALYAALCDAAQAQPCAQDREDDEALADTQRAIIEAAERRGYERAIAECAQDRKDAQRYRDIRAAVRQIGENQLWTELCVITAKTADVSVPEFDRRIDAARAAKGADHG